MIFDTKMVYVDDIFYVLQENIVNIQNLDDVNPCETKIDYARRWILTKIKYQTNP